MKKTDQKIAGEGWELSVFRKEDGDFYIAIPVDSSFVSSSFDFEITKKQAEYLCGNSNQRNELNHTLHEMLQGRLTKGQRYSSDAECLETISKMCSKNENTKI